MWVKRMDVRNVRNRAQAGVDLAPGLIVIVGRNAQGKTTHRRQLSRRVEPRGRRTRDGQGTAPGES